MKAFNLSNNIIFISFFVIMLFMYLTGLKLLYPPYYTVLPFFIIGLLGFFINARSIKKEYIVVLLIIFFSFFLMFLAP